MLETAFNRLMISRKFCAETTKHKKVEINSDFVASYYRKLKWNLSVMLMLFYILIVNKFHKKLSVLLTCCQWQHSAVWFILTATNTYF